MSAEAITATVAENISQDVPEAGETVSPRANWRLAQRLGGIIFAGTVLVFPLAEEQSLRHAAIDDNLASAPATFSYMHSGGSEIEGGLLGNIYIPRQQHGIGIRVRINDMPAFEVTDPAQLTNSRLIPEISSLYHDPGKATKGVEKALEHRRKDELESYQFALGLAAGTITALGLLAATEERRRHLQKNRTLRLLTIGAISAAALGPSLYAAYDFHEWGKSDSVAGSRYPLGNLDGTALDGTTVSNTQLQFALENLAPKVQLLYDRQEQKKQDFYNQARRELISQTYNIHRPAEDETAFLVLSDMHDNEVMTQLATDVVDLNNSQNGGGTIKFVLMAGDSTYGTAGEQKYIEEQAHISQGAPTVVAPGNHDSAVTEQQMDDAGMIRLSGKSTDVRGIRILGDEDPMVTPFLGSPVSRYSKPVSEAQLGNEMYQKALASHPQVVALHEGYAMASFLGLGDISHAQFDSWLRQGGSNQVSAEDVRDQPASVEVFGHWHEDVPPRIVWNSDGTWTLVMDINTAGGAVGDPTFNNFSLPNGAPAQTASFPVIYMNKNTGLVTGYQLYRFEPDGMATIENFSSVGLPGGIPGDTEPSALGRNDAMQTNDRRARQK